MSPTISSRMSSSVTRPITSPYSSTTSAKCVLRRRNALSCSPSGRKSGTNHGGRATALMSIFDRSPCAAWIARSRSLACRMPMMFSGAPSPQRQPGHRARRERRATIVLRRIVGVHRDHLGAMEHDVGHGELAQVEHAAEHVEVVLLHPALVVQQIDGSAQFLVRGQDRHDPRRCARRTDGVSRAPGPRSPSAPARAGARPRASAAPPGATSGREH